jgi:transmembrane sensor
MSPISEQQAAVIKQAIEWYQRLEQGQMAPVWQRKFAVWLKSGANAKELARICLIHTLLKRAPLGDEARPRFPENVIDFQDYAPALRLPVPQPAVSPPLARRFSFGKLAIAVSATVVVFAVALASVLTKEQTIVTSDGHWGKELLADGTVVHAGPNTKLRFDFEEHKRSVTLVRGEALFEVAKAPGRPFIVTTDVGTVQALGTAFATADMGDQVVVTVASGKVAVTVASGAQPMMPLGANQQVVLSSAGIRGPVTVNAQRDIKWIRNWYEYDGEQVGEIVAQLNRRHSVKVVVDDPQAARLRISSLTFKPSEPQEFVARVNLWYASSPQKAGDPGALPVLHLQP